MSTTKSIAKPKTADDAIAKMRAVYQHLKQTRDFGPYIEKYTDEHYSK